MHAKILEIACFNLESAIIAQEAGADRIELCINYSAGGLTPPEDLILEVRSKIQIPIHVIIRPREGDFVYSKDEVKEMKKSILFCKDNKINGLVLGCLTSKNEIDELLCRELLDLAAPLPLTFHRAIDSCLDLSTAIQKITKLGFKRILTSGGKANAFEGIKILAELQDRFKNRITVMPGGGIRSEIISEIINETHCGEYHSAALLKGSNVCDANEIKKLKLLITKTS